ncbi:membrane protein [Marmoricola endophyticus]|uniref:Membrane protein n=1 Tax=Marmoricola endophyticus TaxID=2040280 RepID=A0A917BMN5_9ACTN|nr:phage holin family protein [Marmoricola endophyticus]GGF49733.1 membrane protein [Marmoricola endophyticus]
MSEQTPGTRSTAEESTGQLVAQLGDQLGTLVRAEMELARAELTASAKRAGLGAGLFGTAGVIGLYTVGCAVATAILALALVVDAWLAALIVTVVLALIAAVATLIGKKQIGAAPAPVQHSVASVKTDVDIVTHHEHDADRAEESKP